MPLFPSLWRTKRSSRDTVVQNTRHSSKIIEILYSFPGHNLCLIKTNIMANLKVEVTFKVTFNNLGVPDGIYSSAIIYDQCAKQIYASAPWSKIGHQKDARFKVEMINKSIRRD